MSHVTPLAFPRFDEARSPNRPERPFGNDGGLSEAAASGDLTELAIGVANGQHGRLGTDGWAPLHHAAFAGQVASAQLLIAGGADVDQRSDHGCSGATPLLCAAAGGHAPLVDLLLARGARVEARDEAGYTSLLLASELGHAGVVRALLLHGADATAEIGDTGALELARRGRHARVVALLRQRGATR